MLITNNIGSYRPLLVAMLAVAAVSMASAQKTAFIASEAILDRFPDAQAARGKLIELQTGWMREIQRQEEDRDKLAEEMQASRLLWSQQERRDAEARLHDIEAKLGTFRAAKFGPGGEFESKQKELMGPVFDQIQKAIEEVARAQKYDIVLDKSSRGLPMVYANPAFDLTAFVLKRLGVEVDDSEIPKESADTTQSEGNARKNRGRRDADAKPDPNGLLKTDPPEPEKQDDAP